MQNKKQYGIFKEVIRGLSDSKHRKTSGKLRFIFTIKCNSFLRGRAMLTHKSIYFLFTACLCGVFFCFSAEAKVCFLGDTDCNQGVRFDNYVELDTKSMCAPEYTTLYNECNNIGGVCPYDNQYVKCCGMEYAYQACISPLENARKADGSIDKCGNLYRCQCPEEYKISSTYAQQNSCLGGGGYCILNDGENDLIYYKNCTCDRTNYPDKESCKNNQTESASCKDDQENIYKKCYCDRGVFPYSSCEYGNKGKVCIDSSSQRAYYEECKSAREKCLEENFIAETLSQCPQGSSGCVSEITGNSYYCTLGDGCPYPVTPQLYQCKFDKARWCKDKGYDQVSDSPITEGSKCTLDGFEGTVVLCPENTDTANYYYQCKLSCINQAKSAASKGNLTMITDGTYGDHNNPAFKRTINNKNHLYISKNLGTNDTLFNPGNGNNHGYSSVNGLRALYDLDSIRYSSCRNEGNPRIFLSPNTDFLSKDFSYVNLVLYRGVYEMQGTHTWKNINLWDNTKYGTTDSPYPKICDLLPNEDEQFYFTNKTPTGAGGCGGDDQGSMIQLSPESVLTFTGNIYFSNNHYSFGSASYGIKASMYFQGFVAHEKALVIFKDATIRDDRIEWDGGYGGTMLFINSTGSVGKVFSKWNIGLKNSNINFINLFISPFNAKDANCSFGGRVKTSDNYSSYSSAGLFLTDNSTLSSAMSIRVAYDITTSNNSTYTYIGDGSKISTDGAFVLHDAIANDGPDDNHSYSQFVGNVVCLNNGTLKAGSKEETGTKRALVPASFSNADQQVACISSAVSNYPPCQIGYTVTDNWSGWMTGGASNQIHYPGNGGNSLKWLSNCQEIESYGLNYYDPNENCSY